MLLPDTATSSTLLIMVPPWDPRIPPLGIASLAEYLRAQGRQVAALDLNNVLLKDGSAQPSLWQASLEAGYWDRELHEGELGRRLAALAVEVAASKVKVVGLSTTRVSSMAAAYLAGRLREAREDLYIVAGGPGTEDGEARAHMAAAGVDYFVLGEGEVTLHALLAPLLQGLDAPTMEGVIPGPHRTLFPFKPRPPADLATLCLPLFEDFDLDDYAFPGMDRRLALQTSRGCDHRCAFCVDRHEERPLRTFPPALIARALVLLAERHRLDQVELTDLVLNGAPEVLGQWCELLIEHGLRLFWTGQLTIHEEMTVELLRAMREAGCIGARFGVESGSDRVLSLMGRSFDSRLTSKVLHRSREAGLHTEINLMVGFPGETEEDFQQTLEFIAAHASCLDKVDLISTCELRSGCSLEADAERFGVSPGQGATDFTDSEGNTGAVRDRRAEELARHLSGLGVRLGLVVDEAFREGRPNLDVEQARAGANKARLQAHSSVEGSLCLTVDDGGRNVSINAGEVPLSAVPGLGMTLEVNGNVVDMTDGRWAAWTEDDGVHLESALLFSPVRLRLAVSPVPGQGVDLRLILVAEAPVRLGRVRVGLLLGDCLQRCATLSGEGDLLLEDEADEVTLCDAPARSILLAAAREEGEATGGPRLGISVLDDFFWDIKLNRDPRGRRLLLDRSLDEDAGGREFAPGPHILFAARLGLLDDDVVPVAHASGADDRSRREQLDEDFALVLCPPWQIDTPPLWTATLAGALRADGLEGSCHDLNSAAFRGVDPVEHRRWERGQIDRWRHGEDFDESWTRMTEVMAASIQQILERQPAVVGFTTTEANLLCSLRLAQMIKEAVPVTRVVFGGPGVHWSRQQGDAAYPVNMMDPWTGEHLDQAEAVDVYLRGEADESLPAVVRRLNEDRDPLEVPGTVAFRCGRWVSPSPPQWPRDLDALALPDFSDLDLPSFPRGFAPISFGRGCAVGCAHCNDCNMQGPPRARAPERIMEEVLSLHRDHGIRGLAVTDLVLNAEPVRLARLCDLLSDSDLDLRWSGMCHPAGLDRDLLEKMARSGCGELVFSLDSLAQTVVDSMRKGFDVAETLENMAAARELGIVTTACLMVGYPRETPELFEETVQTLGRHAEAFSRIRTITSCHLTHGSRLWESPDRYGIDSSGETPWYDWRGPFDNNRAERLRRVQALRDEAVRLGLEVESWEEEGEDAEVMRALVPSH